jgi:F0F1-type ATP synthase membrane subunit c/vacuolar-type H+-ATPase subunit K
MSSTRIALLIGLVLATAALGASIEADYVIDTGIRAAA